MNIDIGIRHSGYAYVEAFLSQNQECWITAHINAFNFFGGVSRIMVPDNLKTGVDKVTKSDVFLNKIYQEMAEHYGVAVIPARVKVLKDKPTVEGTVGIISTWIRQNTANMGFLEYEAPIFHRKNLQFILSKELLMQDAPALHVCHYLDSTYCNIFPLTYPNLLYVPF